MQNSKIHAMLQEMFKKKGMEVNVCHLEDGFFFFFVKLLAVVFLVQEILH